MSETAQTLIKAALRAINATASGEVPTTDEYADALESLKLMLRHWSDNNIRLYVITQNTLALSGATSYTIGSGGDCNTTRPEIIKGGYIRDAYGVDTPLHIIDEAKYRNIILKSMGGTAYYLWYNPDYPLGKLYFWPLGSGTAYLDSLKPLTEPSAITDSIAFPPPYDEAIKWNLALRLAPEFGKEPSQLIGSFAISALRTIESKNLDVQMNAADLNEELQGISNYNIDE